MCVVCVWGGAVGGGWALVCEWIGGSFHQGAGWWCRFIYISIYIFIYFFMGGAGGSLFFEFF